MVSLNINVNILLKLVFLYSLMSYFCLHIGTMHLQPLCISLITCRHLSSLFPLRTCLCLIFSPSNYTKLCIFGCLCYPWLRTYSNHKFEPRSIPCVFVGYSLTRSAYLCVNPSTSKINISRHVNYAVSIFLFKSI